jgi:hypothetical protein
MLFHSKIFETNAENVESITYEKKDDQHGEINIENVKIILENNYKFPKPFEIIECLFPKIKAISIKFYKSYIWGHFLLKIENDQEVHLNIGSSITIYKNNEIVFEKKIT